MQPLQYTQGKKETFAMSRFWTQSALLLLVVVLASCTDGRSSRGPVQILSVTPPPTTGLVSAASVQFGGRATDSLQMMIKGNSLFLTGRPFGFSRWDIGSDPESPVLTFAASDQLATFSPMGSWVVDWYAGGAMTVYGQTAILSGTVGASVVSLADTNRPKEVQRYPALVANSATIPTDPAYVYSALVAHPTKPLLYGFRQQDYLYTIDVSGGTMRLASRYAYGNAGETVCCAMGATVFQGKVYVAFRDRLLIYSISEDGTLSNPEESLELNATNVVSSANRLYVQHDPTKSPSSGSTSPAGIYVFDANRNNVAFFAAGSPRKFAVSQDDRYFIANMDGTSVKIFRIQWTN